MPTPHGTRGALAFSADEVRVVRRALAEVLHPSRTAVPAPAPAADTPADTAGGVIAPRRAAYVQDYLRLAEGVDEALHEAGRMHGFHLEELARYRQALPGSASGYLERLRTALARGHMPAAEDLAALRLLRALPCGTAEQQHRTALLRRCETLAEIDVRLRLEAHMPSPRRLPTLPVPALADEPEPSPKKPGDKPAEPPAAPERDKPAEPAPREPGRRTPTPAEIWPPHRRHRKPDEARSA
jgi:hypothetical protein